MQSHSFDRSREDIGNSIGLGHVNVQVPDQQPATSFYVSGLGLTRDPYLMTGIGNMWVNCGLSQFHLFGAAAQVVRGIIGLVIPDRAELLARLEAVRPELANTQFDFHARAEYVEATCPWGNRFRCHTPDTARFGRMALGIAYVEFGVRTSVAARIVRFYREVLGIPSQAVTEEGDIVAQALVGDHQYLRFRESAAPERPYDGHHVQLYLADFSGPHRRLEQLRLIVEESSQYQYRFVDIVDVESREPIFKLEHEIRSLTHPLFGRPLVNRYAKQTGRDYRPGWDADSWALR